MLYSVCGSGFLGMEGCVIVFGGFFLELVFVLIKGVLVEVVIDVIEGLDGGKDGDDGDEVEDCVVLCVDYLLDCGYCVLLVEGVLVMVKFEGVELLMVFLCGVLLKELFDGFVVVCVVFLLMKNKVLVGLLK